ncbi:MAG: hypothetical protein HY680_06865 [Chloroflexi bacterium]|nr:hypothetical protein [Chloroflexota bacterium]
MPYYKVTWEVTVRAKDKAEAVPKADAARQVGDCEVTKVPLIESLNLVKEQNPEFVEAHWPSVTFVLANGETWQGAGPLLEVLDHFLEDGLHLIHVVAIIPTRD